MLNWDAYYALFHNYSFIKLMEPSKYVSIIILLLIAMAE